MCWQIYSPGLSASLIHGSASSPGERRAHASCTVAHAAQARAVPRRADLAPLTLASQGTGNYHIMTSAKTVHGLSLIMHSRYSRALQPSSLLAQFLPARFGWTSGGNSPEWRLRKHMQCFLICCLSGNCWRVHEQSNPCAPASQA